MATKSEKRSDDFLLLLILRALWQGRGIFVLCVGIAVLLGFLFLILAKPKYRAVATISPISSSASLGRAQGAFAAITGMTLGGDHDADFSDYLLVLHSASLADRLAKNDGLDKELLSGWDPETKQWLPPSGPMALLRRLLGRTRPAPPSASHFAEYLTAEVMITALSSSGPAALAQNRSYLVSFDHTDAAGAARILRTMLHEADYVMRQSQMEATQNRVKYLREQLRITTEIPLREGLQSLLTSEQQNLMSEHVDQYYSIKVVDQPHADDVPSSPRAILTMAIALIVGLLISAAVNLILLWRRFTRAEATGRPMFDPPFPNPLRRLEALWSR